jgi:hypothetical protein
MPTRKTKTTKPHTADMPRMRRQASEGNQIRNWRLYRGLKTHADLAAATVEADPNGKGLERSILIRLETGKTHYAERHLDILARTLGVEQRDLISTNPFDDADIYTILAFISERDRKRWAKLMRKKPKK